MKLQTRREFQKLFGVASLLTLGAAVSGATRRVVSSSKILGESARVATIGELAVGEYKLFRYPTDNDPCILIHLASDEYVAFSQSCTHLKCPVHFHAQKRQLICPCHEGYFSAHDGRPLAGPPKRALTQFAVEIKGDSIHVRLMAGGDDVRNL